MKFKLFGFPVEVHWTFFILALVLGRGRTNPVLLLTWVAVVFVSILLHELGHAITGRMYGLDAEIRLYGMGGVTMWQAGAELPPVQRIQISLAGPVTGFAVAGLAFVVRPVLPPGAPFLVHLIAYDLFWVNLVWGLLNLLPILPLDGGQVMRSIVHLIVGPYEERLPLMISIIVGIAAGVVALKAGMYWGAILAGMFTYMNYTALQNRGRM